MMLYGTCQSNIEQDQHKCGCVQYNVLSWKDVHKEFGISPISKNRSQQCNTMFYHGKWCNIA